MQPKNEQNLEKGQKPQLLYIAVTLLCTFTFFVFGPLNLFISNIDEFWFGFNLLFPVIITVFVCTTLIMYCFLAALPKKTAEYATMIFFGLGLALYLQGNYWMIDYGRLDGAAIDWGAYLIPGIINALLWLALIAIPVIIYRIKGSASFSFYKLISMSIIIVQLMTLFILTPWKATSEIQNDYIFTRDGQWDLSSEKNIIVFVPDCFDASYMESYLRLKDAEVFNDFVFYRNTVGGATRTKIALPYMLSGEIYLADQGYPDYLHQAYANSPLLNILHSNGYDVRIYTFAMLANQALTASVDNVSRTESSVTSNIALARYYYKFIAYQFTPQFLKKYFWMYSGDFDDLKATKSSNEYTISDADFYKSLLENGLRITSDQPAFRFYHLFGTHPPYTLNEKAEQVPPHSSSLEQQLKGTLKIIRKYIEQLKALGVYDQSSIFIMSDHGAIGYDQNPLLMVKGFNSNQSFSVSDAPISYADFIPTITEGITGDVSETERSIFSIAEGEKRERVFYNERSANNIITIQKRITSGHASDVGSFILSDIYEYAREATAYKLNSTLDFGLKATANAFCISGFSTNEGTHTWTNDSKAKMLFNLQDAENKDLVLRLRAKGYLGGDLSHQRIGVYVNDSNVANWRMTGIDWYEAEIPAETVGDNGVIEVVFAIPDHISPREAGESGDTRKLGIAALKLQIVEKHPDR